MKALTICQPYADMIVKGEKIIENRTWLPPENIIGQRIAIHAGKSRSWLEDGDEQERPDMVFGAVVATAVLKDARQFKHLSPELQERMDANGPYCWVLEDVEVFDRPIPCRGAQGLWDWART